jgi:hypothetical protein
VNAVTLHQPHCGHVMCDQHIMALVLCPRCSPATAVYELQLQF